MSRYQLLVAEIDLSLPPLPEGARTLLTLEQASWLPELGDTIDVRALWRAADALRLQTTRPTGRRLYTTRAWIADWIAAACLAPLNNPDSSTKMTVEPGRSGTRASPAGVAASASLAARLTLLKGR